MHVGIDNILKSKQINFIRGRAKLGVSKMIAILIRKLVFQQQFRVVSLKNCYQLNPITYQ